MKVNLSDSEWRIMTLLWEDAPKTMMQLTNLLAEETGWTKHTVLSFLKRMEEKGAVHHQEGKKAKLYYPVIPREDAVLQETEEFLDRVFQGKIGLLFHTMVEQKAVSKEELEEIARILKEAEKNE